jgi:3-oxoacyl-[acyl-carrier protein] reductase
MDTGLGGRVVLVTGGGGGAGPTIARAFAAEGAAVAVHYRSSAARAEAVVAAIRVAGGRAIGVAADLRSSAEAGSMVERTSNELGPVTVLVTATSAYRSEALVDIDDGSWARVTDDVLGATYRACRAVVPGMVETGWGRIVNIAARSGLVGVAKSAHYAAAKAGVIGLTRSLAKELGPSGILVNAVAPTQILTEKDGVLSIQADRAERLAAQIPIRRVATADDLAATVLWLGSGANTYVSGEVVTLGGGARS